jgi:hypothetical protein
VISAPWIPTTNLASPTSQNPDREIAVVSHSNIGFLHADPGAIELLRQGSELEQGCPNFHIAANSQGFQTWWQSTYERRPSSLDSKRVGGCFSERFAYKTASSCPRQLHVCIP